MPNETWQSDFTHYRLTAPTAPGTDVEIISWLDDYSRYALHVTAHPRVTGPIVVATFRDSRSPARDSRLDADRQRHGLHHPVRPAASGGRNGFEHELRRLGRRPEELPPQPPHHLRQGRALPADHEELAPRPTRPARHHRRAAGPARRASSTDYNHHRPHRSLPQPGHPRRRLRPPGPKPPRRPAATPTPTTGSATTASTPPAASPSATTAACTTSASAEPTPEPTSCCSSTTSTSASSTPPPANSSASSPSTPPATTSPPAAPKPGPTPANEQQPNPQS